MAGMTDRRNGPASDKDVSKEVPGLLDDVTEALMLGGLLSIAWPYTLLYLTNTEQWAFGLRKLLLPLSMVAFLTGWYAWRWVQFQRAGRWQQWLYWHKLELGILLILGILSDILITIATLAIAYFGMQFGPSGFGSLLLMIVMVFGSMTYLPGLILLLHVPIMRFLLRRNHPSMPLWRALRLSMLAATGWSLLVILPMIIWSAIRAIPESW